MTPDGISDEDWAQIHELAVEVANAGDDDQLRRVQVENLFRALDQLEGKYGLLPSILATRGDYVDDVAESNALLERAYRIAVERGDKANSLYTASSLARKYITVLRDRHEGKRWLSAMDGWLKVHGDESDIFEYQELARDLDSLERESTDA